MDMDKQLLKYSAVAYVVTVASLFVLSYVVIPFDASEMGSFLNRWDVAFFDDIAKNGYYHEQQFAFMPGLPFLMSVLSTLTRLPPVAVGSLLSGIAFCLATVAFFRLSTTIGFSPKTAFTAACLFILSPSPATLHGSPYTEPFAALSIFLALDNLHKDNIVLSSIFFGVSSLFRAQCIIASVIFLGWNVLTKKGRFRYESAIGLLVSLVPFVLFEFSAYSLFCLAGYIDKRPWCPYMFSYPWIQSHYWNVGFLKYWTVAQIPNFLMALPVLLVWGLATYDFFKKTHYDMYIPLLTDNSDTLAPYAIYSLVLGLILVFSAHVQISLRLLALNPLLYWFLAEAEERIFKSWVYYAGIWSGVSLVLWAGYYPPA